MGNGAALGDALAPILDSTGAFSSSENLTGRDALSDVPDFHRRLPHQHPEGKWLFATWHLHGSLPHARYPPPDKLASGAAFVWMDRYLDTARQGPMYLAQESIAAIVVASLRRGAEMNHYDLGAYVVMSNHVHVLLLPKIPPSRLVSRLRERRRERRIVFWDARAKRSGRRSLTTIGFETRKNGSELRLTSKTTLLRRDSSAGPRITVGRAPERAPRRVSALQTRVSAPHSLVLEKVALI